MKRGERFSKLKRGGRKANLYKMAEIDVKIALSEFKETSQWLNWKTKTRIQLINESLWTIVDGTRPLPAVGEEDIRRWRIDNVKAQRLLLNVLGPEPMSVVSRSTEFERNATAAALWSALCAHYNRQMEQQRQQLEDQFHDCFLLDGDDASAWINRLSRLAADIRACGGTMDFPAYRAKVFSSMPPSWRVAKQTLTGQTNLNDEISLNAKIKGMYYAMQSDIQADRRGGVIKPAQSLLAQDRQQEGGARPPFKSGARSRSRGRGRGVRGARGGGSNESASGYFNGDCNYCGKHGHKEIDCRKKKSDQGNGSYRGAHTRRANDAHAIAESQGPTHDAVIIRRGATARVLNSVLADQPGDWCVDSGASFHMVNNLDLLTDVEELVRPIEIQTATQDGKLRATHRGKTTVRLPEELDLLLPLVFYVKQLNGNLLSVHALLEQGVKVVFDKSPSNCCRLIVGDYEIVAPARHGSYMLHATATGAHQVNGKDTALPRASPATAEQIQQGEDEVEAEGENADITTTGTSTTTKKKEASAISSTSSAKRWHQLTGHVSLKKMLQTDAVREELSEVEVKQLPPCHACEVNKMTRVNHPVRESAQRVNQLLHMDLCGPMRTTGHAGERYFAVFIDDASRWTGIYPLNFKTDILQATREHISTVMRLVNLPVGALRMDNALEFKTQKFMQMLSDLKVAAEYVPTYASNYNGKAERANRTILQMVRCILFDAELPLRFWPLAAMHAADIFNRLPSSALSGRSPYELVMGRKPSWEHIFVFGEKVVCWQPKQYRADPKLGEQGGVGLYMGGVKSGGYQVYFPRENMLCVESDIRVYGGGGVMAGQDPYPLVKGPEEPKTLEVEESPATEVDSNEVIKPPPTTPEGGEDVPRAKRILEQESDQPIAKAKRMLCEFSEEETMSSLSAITYAATHITEVEPVNWKEAENLPERDEWVKGIDEEMASHVRNKTFSIVEKDTIIDSKVLFSKFIFKLKRKPSGEIERYKARWVICGNSQRPGLDFEDASSGVLGKAPLRFLFCLAVREGLYIEQWDAITAFLNSEIDRPTFVRAPEGADFAPGTILQLHRGIYGLRQAGRLWSQTIRDFLLSTGWSRFKGDHNVYSRDGVYLSVYVDDFLCFSRSSNISTKIFEEINNRFPLKMLGPVSNLLGMQITQQENRVEIRQEAYINKIARKHKLSKFPRQPLPVGEYAKIREGENSALTEAEISVYRGITGELQYVANASRPDLLFAANFLGRAAKAPTKADMELARYVMGFLVLTKSSVLVYDNNNIGDGEKFNISIFCDADLGSGKNKFGPKSTTGYLVFVNDNPVFWKSNVQKRTATSTCEAELTAMFEASMVMEAVLQLYEDIGLDRPEKVPVYCDSQSAISVVKSGILGIGLNKRAREFTSLHELYEDNVMNPVYVASGMQRADILTKGLAMTKHQELASKCGVRIIYQ